jgi:polyisoprenoid-binding protein YceI
MQFAAHAGHFLLYALMIAIPLSGWLMSSAKGFQTVWFGVLPIPDLLGKNKELGDLLQTVHMSLNLLFVAVIVGHIGAALKHHFIDKDDILTRMLPGHPRRTDMKRIALAFALATALSAQAVEYTQVQADKSSVAFTYKQMGVAVDGKFKRFSSQLSFDPAKPTAARATFDVELASVDTGAPEGDDEVAGKPWFNTKAFPTARFVSSGVKALGGNKYEVAGQLSIKGKTQDVVVPPPSRRRATAASSTAVSPSAAPIFRSAKVAGPSSTSSPTTSRSSSASPQHPSKPSTPTGESP